MQKEKKEGGPATCRKTFMLKPLQETVNVSQPLNKQFCMSWGGTSEYFLNDFHWSKKLISCQDLSKLLECKKTIHIAAQKIFTF